MSGKEQISRSCDGLPQVIRPEVKIQRKWLSLLREVKRLSRSSWPTAQESLHSSLDGTEIVTPEKADLLDTGYWSGPSLTLATCYPFGYVEVTPKRLLFMHT
jgi:hypothetical protein